MKKAVLISVVILLTGLLAVTGCQPDAGEPLTPAPGTDTGVIQAEPEAPYYVIPIYGNTPAYPSLDHARPYLVITEGNLANQDLNRSVGLWMITSPDASGFEDYAQTAARAVLDLYFLHKRDFTSVSLLPGERVEIAYAHASFAADGRGPAGMTGSAPAAAFYWKIRAADRELSERELAIAELWSAKLQDFPQSNPLSSCSYDPEALRRHISDTLDIPYDEVQMPALEMHEYKLDQSFIDWTMSLAACDTPKPLSDIGEKIKVEPTPGSYLTSGGEVSGIILKDVRVSIEPCDEDYFSPWFPAPETGEPCLVVSGHVQNLDKEKFEIAMSAEGFNAAGEWVAGTLDAAHIAGAIGLHLEFQETGAFTLHLNLPEDICTIRIIGANSLVTPP